MGMSVVVCWGLSLFGIHVQMSEQLSITIATALIGFYQSTKKRAAMPVFQKKGTAKDREDLPVER
jgi:hypothetical protein